MLDVRAVTLGTLSWSENPACASNAISFGAEDGTCFAGVAPESDRSVPAALAYRVDGCLADGAPFLPDTMEHKWALFLHRGRVAFVRSWTRRVAVTADVEVADGTATIVRVNGTFTEDANEDPGFTVRAADYLIRTHALGVPFPAPLKEGMADDPRAAALWCMSCFGKLAEYATPHAVDAPVPAVPLRTHSLLHIAVARGDRDGVLAQLAAGVPPDLLAKDGLTPLHWSLAGSGGQDMAALLLDHGSPVDARSTEGATPLMNAVQGDQAEWVDFLLGRGADPDARDGRGFTALHRAAEMGKLVIVRRLLDAGANPHVEAEGHTPLSLGRGRNEVAVVELLTGR